MSCSFVRAIWGSCLSTGGIKSTVLEDVLKERNNQFCPKFRVYVFGTENLAILSHLGFDCVLLNEEPVIYDMEKQLWRHKLDVFKAAMEDYDEIVYMDWDCIAKKPVSEDIWDDLNKKEKIQANLMLYRTKKCLWRDEDLRKTCNGGFVYIRDKNAPDGIIKAYEGLHEWLEEQKIKRAKRNQELRFREKALIFDDEPAISKYLDEYMGGWKGLMSYWMHFEPSHCNIKKSAFDRELLESKEEIFRHWV